MNESTKRCPTCGIQVDSKWLNCPADGAWLSSMAVPFSSPNTVDTVLEKLTKELLQPIAHQLEQAQSKMPDKNCPKCKASYPPAVNACPVDATPLYFFNLTGHILNGTYKVIAVLGEGATSEVYRAQHLYLDRQVAVKVIKPLWAYDDTRLKRFFQESRAVSNLSHPGIVALHDFGLTADQRPYQVTDLLTGETLDCFVKSRGPLGQDSAISIFKRVSDALSHAHLRGIIHRDVKPANIMVTDGPELIKIIDFGLAKMLPSSGIDSLQATREGIICGSPRYMSPEQCEGKSVDARSDIYAVGVSMFEALSGRPPFYSEDAIGIIVQHLQSPVPSLRKDYGLPIAEELETVVRKCLEKSPENRYQTMQELRKSLDKISSGQATLITPSKPAATGIRILIVDDEEVSLFACAMAVRKQQDLEVSGIAINGELAFQKVGELRPDVVVMDFELPVCNGADATRLIKKHYPDTRVLILSSHTDRNTVIDAFSAGADGYVLKSLPGERLFTSIRTVAVGSLWIDDGLDEDLVFDARELVYSKNRDERVMLSGCLSSIEFDLLKLIIEGLSDEQIGVRLNIDIGLLRTYKQSLLRFINTAHKTRS
ncbi:MAG: protein kinase [Candidatus Obscuribacterales bacterium]|nr:protein kinase [Candidatus Obscuribacterales bacterium]